MCIRDRWKINVTHTWYHTIRTEFSDRVAIESAFFFFVAALLLAHFFFNRNFLLLSGFFVFCFLFFARRPGSSASGGRGCFHAVVSRHANNNINGIASLVLVWAKLAPSSSTGRGVFPHTMNSFLCFFLRRDNMPKNHDVRRVSRCIGAGHKATYDVNAPKNFRGIILA